MARPTGNFTLKTYSFNKRITWAVTDFNKLHSFDTVKTHIKEQVFWGFRLILFLILNIGRFLQNQPENVLKVFLKLLI